ncbi:MAG: AlpA family transcriptional regulator [Burkholderiaceae bacterium]|nr:AlpA family transcriptional regulator [Burkholderiaceae bacterium]
MSARNLRRPEVLTKTGLSKTSLYNLERAGSFPQHIMLTPRLAVWSEADVDAWIASSRATPVSAAAAPDVAMRKTVGKRRAAAGPQLNEIRQMLRDAMSLLDKVERQGMTTAVSVATCWNKAVGVAQ